MRHLSFQCYWGFPYLRHESSLSRFKHIITKENILFTCTSTNGMMAGRRGSAEDATVSRSSTSSSLSSSKSDSEGNSTDATGTNSVDLPTSGSEGKVL